MEIWKPIPGWPGFEASNLGRIKKLPYVTRLGGKRKEQIIRPNGEHCVVTLNTTNKKSSSHVGRLVLLAFRPKRPPTLRLAIHWDDDPWNNVLSNLRWGDHRDNAKDAIRNGIMGKDSPHARKLRTRWANMSITEYNSEIIRRRKTTKAAWLRGAYGSR